MSISEAETNISNNMSVSGNDMTNNNNNYDSTEYIPTNIANILGYNVEDENTCLLVFGEELYRHGVVLKTYNDSLEEINYNNNVNSITEVALDNTEIVDVSNKEKTAIDRETEEINAILEEEQLQIKEENASRMARTTSYSPEITFVDQSDALLETESPDENYTGCIVELTPEDRDLLERLVMGEAGGEGFEGAALVAQAIRDTIVYKGYTSVESVRTELKYSGSINKEPNQTVLDAVSYIFDDGGIAVKHSIFYFYAPKRVKSKFHESQKFIVEYGGHRFFGSN